MAARITLLVKALFLVWIVGLYMFLFRPLSQQRDSSEAHNGVSNVRLISFGVILPFLDFEGLNFLLKILVKNLGCNEL